MKKTSLEQQYKQAYQEVLDLHIQIERLFHGQAFDNDRSSFLSYFHPDFTMIPPDGILRDFTWLSGWCSNALGSRPQVKISIENFNKIFASPEHVIITYEEHQQITMTESLRRSSTAVLMSTNHQKPSFLWYHLHETWMD
ncbi:hypothetical protein [Legionella nagasakiensis]|uniref:hypothetical protein n=1 Tax=Legionella nagasakiensis TaxID=535290 RepID=UPI001055129F|nr:hypothetical protein [Legionella nagasakiensis]